MLEAKLGGSSGSIASQCSLLARWEEYLAGFAEIDRPPSNPWRPKSMQADLWQPLLWPRTAQAVETGRSFLFIARFVGFFYQLRAATLFRIQHGLPVVKVTRTTELMENWPS